MKISSIPKAGRKGSVVYLNTRHGKVAREYVCPRSPRSPEQQGHRRNVRAVTGRWRTLSTAQRAAWCAATANKYFVNEAGCWVRLNGYHHFVSLNTRPADLGPPQFDLPASDRFAHDGVCWLRFNGYHVFVSVNPRRAEPGPPQFVPPPAVPVFSPNP